MSDHRLFDDSATDHSDGLDLRRAPGRRDTERIARARGSALWAAFGDALGFISELTDEAGLRRRTRGQNLTFPIEWKRRIGGRSGVNATLPVGCYSDDTQLRLASGRAIGPTGFDVEAFAKVELTVWPAYALGGGLSTKAAASNLAKTTTAWFSNTYQGWRDSGGNGAAMRIHPHVWAARDLAEPPTFMLDVLRNSVCSHAHPTALLGAALHALTLAHTMATGDVPDPSTLAKLVDVAAGVPSMVRDDPQLGELWLTVWERESDRSFADAWQEACSDAHESIRTAERCVTSGSPTERYRAVLETLRLLEPDRRGSGILTVVAASALTWCDERPADALAIAANVVGSDTDTIATMAGALMGVVAREEPPVPMMDSGLIGEEAERLTELAEGVNRNGHRYPDLLTWTAPKTQADALFSDQDAGLHVAGLGPIRRTLGDPMKAPQGPFQWQWAELAFGQTILIKRRDELPTIHRPDRLSDDNENRQPRGREARSVPPASDARAEGRSAGTATSRRPAADRSMATTGRGRPLDLRRVIEFVEREQRSDASIGYAVRRVANEGSPEQVAAFLSVLLDLLRQQRRRGDER